MSYSDSKIRNVLTCFGGFYGVFMLFEFYFSNCIGRARNQYGGKRSPIGEEKFKSSRRTFLLDLIVTEYMYESIV